MFLFMCKSLWQGDSPTRALLDYRLHKERVKGQILDLGSGGKDRYSTTIPKDNNACFVLLDLKKGDKVDFETDSLPIENDRFDTVLLLNVLEHLYNYKNLLMEVQRIKTKEGVLIGFVPFLMWYHPDHHDYFRFTHEALHRILTDVGFTEVKVEVIHLGPFTAAFHIIHTSVPIFLRPILFVIPYILDHVFNILRPNKSQRYALGYYFQAW